MKSLWQGCGWLVMPGRRTRSRGVTARRPTARPARAATTTRGHRSRGLNPPPREPHPGYLDVPPPAPQVPTTPIVTNTVPGAACPPYGPGNVESNRYPRATPVARRHHRRGLDTFAGRDGIDAGKFGVIRCVARCCRTSPIATHSAELSASNAAISTLSMCGFTPKSRAVHRKNAGCTHCFTGAVKAVTIRLRHTTRQAA